MTKKYIAIINCECYNDLVVTNLTDAGFESIELLKKELIGLMDDDAIEFIKGTIISYNDEDYSGVKGKHFTLSRRTIFNFQG